MRSVKVAEERVGELAWIWERVGYMVGKGLREGVGEGIEEARRRLGAGGLRERAGA